MKLTDTAIRKAKPSDKPYRLFDGRGLYIEIASSGGKWWRYKYTFQGKEKRLALGTCPDVSLALARERHAAARKLLAESIDPGEHRKATKAARAESAANSFEAIAGELLAMRTRKLASGTAARERRLLDKDLIPYIGSRPIADVTAPELLAALRKIEGRGAIETAHRARALAGQIFCYAIATGRAERNPASDLIGALVQADETHFASVTAPADVGPLLRGLWSYPGTAPVSAALKLAPLVFVRPGELRRARWADIDLDNAEWRFMAFKTGQPPHPPATASPPRALLCRYPRRRACAQALQSAPWLATPAPGCGSCRLRRLC